MDWNSASQPPSGTPYLVGLPHDHEQMGHMLRNRSNPNFRTHGGGGEEGSFGVNGLPSVDISPALVECFNVALFVDSQGRKLVVFIDTRNCIDAQAAVFWNSRWLKCTHYISLSIDTVEGHTKLCHVNT